MSDGKKGHGEFALAREILALSSSAGWASARGEWVLHHVFVAPPSRCLCGHNPIVEHCVLRNRVNGNTTVVGNVCVGKFLGLPSEALFAAGKGWLTAWEREFYEDTLRRRKLSARQKDKRAEINGQILWLVAEAGR